MVITNIKTGLKKYINRWLYSPHELNKIFEFYTQLKIYEVKD